MTPLEHDALLKSIDRALVALETDPNLDDVERDDWRARLLASHLDLPSYPAGSLSVADQNLSAQQLLSPSEAQPQPVSRRTGSVAASSESSEPFEFVLPTQIETAALGSR
jgi:hypothetical protein